MCDSEVIVSPEETECLKERKWWCFLLSSIFTFLAGLALVLIWRALAFICCRKGGEYSAPGPPDPKMIKPGEPAPIVQAGPVQPGMKPGRQQQQEFEASFMTEAKDWAGELISGQTTTGRILVTFSCMMDLSKFPLDRQTCTMEVASFSKTVEELILDWKPENPITTGSLGMTQFEMVDIIASKCHESFQIGNYSCLVAEFHLARLLGFHLVQSYLPTILMVVISWVSFWMDVNSVPGRVTLGITTLLTVSSKATNVQENIESSYVKAIDVWMGACTAFVFLALMEFTVVNYLWRKEQLLMNAPRVKAGLATPRGSGCRTPSPMPPANDGCEHPLPENSSPTSSCNVGEKQLGNHLEARFIENPNPHHYLTVTDMNKSYSDGHGQSSLDGKKRQKNYQDMAKHIDEFCRVLFPICFTIFVISYWTLYFYL